MNAPIVMTKRLKEFMYFSPTTLEQAVSVLDESGNRAKVLAGGTDLLSMMKLRAVTPECIVSLKKIPRLDYIRDEGNKLIIGAMTTISTILASEIVKQKCLSLHESAQFFGTPQVRNMATVGGNICRSSPSADLVPPLISFDAELRLVGGNSERKLLLEDFFIGPGQNILDSEVLTQITVPLPSRQYSTAFAKLTRNTSDLAKVNCAVKVIVSNGRFDDIRIVLGAVSDRPVRAKKIEQSIINKEITEEVINEAAQKVIEDISPITDARSTAEYRARVSQVLVRRVIKQAIDKSV